MWNNSGAALDNNFSPYASFPFMTPVSTIFLLTYLRALYLKLLYVMYQSSISAVSLMAQRI